jgi:hypothetical protein
MNKTHDGPPLALALAIFLGLIAERPIPFPLLPESVPRTWAGSALLVLGLALGAWAIATLRQAGTRV